MNKEGLKRTIKSAERVLTKYSPGILTGIGIAGMIGATFMAVKATPKALYLIETKKEESEVEELTSPLKLVGNATYQPLWQLYCLSYA